MYKVKKLNLLFMKKYITIFTSLIIINNILSQSFPNNISSDYQVNIEIIPPTLSGDCNEGIKVKLKVVDPGVDYSGPFNRWDYWDFKLYLDFEYTSGLKVTENVYHKRFAPIAFDGRITSSSGTYYTYNFEIPKNLIVDTQTLDGSIARGSLKRFNSRSELGENSVGGINFLEKFSEDKIWCISPSGNDSSEDRDNDGIPNYMDNCVGIYNPDQLDSDGDGYGDACDGSFGGNQPNLTLSGFTVEVGGTTYNTFASESNNNTPEVPEFVNGEEHEFNITIENDDEGNASSSNYLILVSEERVYPNIGSKPVYEVRRDNIGSIKGNSEKTDSFFLFINDFISSLRLENGKTYYLIVDIDHNGAVDESNESGTDNIFYIEFTFKSTTGKIRIVKDLETFYVDYNHSQNTSNILKLANLNSGTIVYQKTLSSNKETVNLPSTTQSGLYGIYVNDKYIKKIGIGSDINNPNNPVLLKPIGN
ncbi:hypothetical protein GCM10011368_27190 [Hyunsoonleella pacifica]|nr:hypothetical protein GCM10011368_27190 [Hyunsoonleella pacifica]